VANKEQEIYAVRLAIKNATQMLRTNIFSMRAAIVLNKPDVIVEILNEMEKTVLELELKSFRSN
jgi:hypothetical protein